MSVAAQLGLDDLDGDLLRQARARWEGWCVQHPALRVVEHLEDLPAWLPGADAQVANEVLHALARIASPRGGDDLAAAGALAWLLLPGACSMAYRLRTLTPRIDEVVAAQLWLEVRGFAWEVRRKVAANVVMNTRRGVMRDLEVGEHAHEVDATWARSVPVEPEAELWAALEARRYVPETSAAAELADLMDWALRAGVIEERDRDLLLQLAAAASRTRPAQNRRGRGGLFSLAARHTVASAMGQSEATVRRRAIAALDAIAEAHANSGAVA